MANPPRGTASTPGDAPIDTYQWFEGPTMIATGAANALSIILIAEHGRILACDGVRSLVASVSGTTIEVTLAEPYPGFEAALRESSGVTSVSAVVAA